MHDVRQLTNYFVYNPALIMLGLIHTHPRMSSFLSSVDIHQLYDYAQDNHSLISIVLAPEKSTSPAYSLTPRGLAEIGKCTINWFHKHKEDDRRFYGIAKHVKNDPATDTTVCTILEFYFNIVLFLMSWL